MYYSNFDVFNNKLNDRELLVRDGVAKLVVCWALWEITRHCRYFPKEVQSWQKIGAWTSERILCSKESDSINKNGISPEARWKQGTPGIIFRKAAQTLLVASNGSDFMSGSKISQNLNQLCTWRDASSNDRIRSLLSVMNIKNWRNTNWIPVKTTVLQGAQNKSVSKRSLDDEGIRVFNNYEPVARMFLGSETSDIAALERTTVEQYKREKSLIYFQSLKPKEIAASPIPLGILLRWGKFFCFGPNLPDDANEEHLALAVKSLPSAEKAAWLAFCGDEDGANGKPVGKFVEAMQQLVEAAPNHKIHEEKARKKSVKMPKPEFEIGFFGNYQKGAKKLKSEIPGFRVNMTSPSPGRKTKLNLGSEGAQLLVRELTYSLQEPTADIYVLASRRLTLRWDISATDNRLNNDTFGKSTWVRKEIQRLNPTLKIEKANWDGSYLDVNVLRNDGDPFSPDEYDPNEENVGIAISEMNFPEAHFGADASHKFSVHHRSDGDGLGIYERVGNRLRMPGETKRSPEQGAFATVEAAYYEIKQKMEEDRSGHDPTCLGQHPFTIILCQEPAL